MIRSLPLIALAAGLMAQPALAMKPHSHTTSATKTHATLRRTSATRSHGRSTHAAAVSMGPERATEIQQALIKNGYMTGEPSGKWDAESIAAMQKMQSDNGWQTKIMPDSRALIKLGLGPGSAPAAANPAATEPAAPAPPHAQ